MIKNLLLSERTFMYPNWLWLSSKNPDLMNEDNEYIKLLTKWCNFSVNNLVELSWMNKNEIRTFIVNEEKDLNNFLLQNWINLNIKEDCDIFEKISIYRNTIENKLKSIISFEIEPFKNKWKFTDASDTSTRYYRRIIKNEEIDEIKKCDSVEWILTILKNKINAPIVFVLWDDWEMIWDYDKWYDFLIKAIKWRQKINRKRQKQEWWWVTTFTSRPYFVRWNAWYFLTKWHNVWNIYKNWNLIKWSDFYDIKDDDKIIWWIWSLIRVPINNSWLWDLMVVYSSNEYIPDKYIWYVNDTAEYLWNKI